MNTIIKNGSKNYNIDLQTNRITMLDARFYVGEDGNYYPSATTILDAYPKGAEYYAWLKKVGEDSDTIRDEAGRRGSVVHDLTERYDQGEEIKLMDENGYIGFKMNEWAMFERYVEFRRRFSFEIVHTEMNLISPTLGFAGTLDRVIEMNGEKILLDIKTSNAIYSSYWLQVAAYEQLITDVQGFNPIDKVAILWLNAKTRTEGASKKDSVQGLGWQLITRKEEETEKDWKLFQATFQLWKAENGTMTPKQMSYQLSHKI